MKRSIPVVVGVAAVGLALVWRCHATGETTTAKDSGPPRTHLALRPDPSTLIRASLAGTVTDEANAPVANVRVCAIGRSDVLSDDLLHEPTCMATDDHGRFELANLYPATYTVVASGKPYRPSVHHPGGDKKKIDVQLVGGEHETGVDITMLPGGVEISGVVADLTGGPIDNARVWTGSSHGGTATTATDAQGKFSLWVQPGKVRVHAAADSYADNSKSASAPGKVEILLTPESSLAGIVIDAKTKQPVEGARVTVGSSDMDSEGDTVFSNARGAFRATRLGPGRYVVVSRTDHGYGRSEGSTLVGLGQHVSGVVVKLYSALRIEGKIVISTTKAPCEDGDISLHELSNTRWIETRRSADGTLYAEGLMPGAYIVEARCHGYQSHTYLPIVLHHKDATGLVWDVEPGATVRGKVLTRAGDPIQDVEVSARTIGGNAGAKTSWGSANSERDGTYELTGLRPGSYKIALSTDRGLGPVGGYNVDVTAGATVERDLVVDDGGTIKGTVVDAEGNAVVGIDVIARGSTTDMFGGSPQKSDEVGGFVLVALRPGEYRVTAQRSWSDELRKPGTTDDAKRGETITVTANQTATVRLVVESQSGVIKGTVVDSDGKPVPDAFVSAARESDAAGAQPSNVLDTRLSEDRPVITSTDGTFTVGKLSPGSYTVRAYRKGGGEAIAEHVAIGGTAKLQIMATGSIAGTVRRDGGMPDELSITVRDQTTGFHRREKFFKSGGHYIVRDVPKGHFQIGAEVQGGQKQIEVDLANNEAKTGVDFKLEGLVTVTGRVVESGTQKPIPGMRMFAQLAAGGASSTGVTDNNGRFTVKNVAKGTIAIHGWPSADSDYAGLDVDRTIAGTGTIDVGDLSILKNRIKQGDSVGVLGINFAHQLPNTTPDKRELKVSFIDPSGPAARTALQVGDIVTTVDGIDVTGESSEKWLTLTRAAPGTTLALGLARSVTVTVVLAAR